MKLPFLSFRFASAALVRTLGALFTGSLLAVPPPFTPGNLVVYTIERLTSGNLSTAATPVFLREFNPNATGAQALIQTIPIDASNTSTTFALTASGTAPSDGQLLLSADGTIVTFAGYNVNAGAASVTTYLARRFAYAGSDGAVSYSAPFLMSGNNVRGAAAGSPAAGFYVFGSDGFGYAATLTAPLFCTTGQFTTRGATIFAGRIFGSTGAGIVNGVPSADIDYNGVNVVEGILPTEPARYRRLPGFTSTVNDSPNGLRFLSLGRSGQPDTLWLALGSSGGGIQRYNFDGTNWTLAYTLNPATAVAFYGLTVRVDPQDPSRVRLYATTQVNNGSGNNAGANQFLTFTDSATPGNTLSPTPVPVTVIATATNSQMFRGVDFAPMPAAPVGTLQLTTFAPDAQGALLVARGEAGRAYMVQSSTDLTMPWQTVSPVLYADQFGTLEYQDTSAPALQRFYRFVTSP